MAVLTSLGQQRSLEMQRMMLQSVNIFSTKMGTTKLFFYFVSFNYNIVYMSVTNHKKIPQDFNLCQTQVISNTFFFSLN